VLTDYAAYCDLSATGWDHSRRMQFDYRAITGLMLTSWAGAHALIIHFDHAAPLALVGDDAATCAVVIAHHRYGTDAQYVLPELTRAALSMSA
jgi:hypothetical protein